MTFDEEMDPYDPVVAERFALLDRVTPLDLRPDGGAARTPMVGPEPAFGRSRYLLAAAAAFLALAGGSALALATTGGDQDVDATDGGGAHLQVDDDSEESAADGETKSLTVEVPSPNAAGSAEGAAGDGTPQDGTGRDDGTSSTTGEAAGGTAEGDTGSATAETPASTQGTTSTPATTAKVEKTTTTKPTTATSGNARPTTTRPSSSDGSWLNPPTPEKMVTIRGIVTEVFTDCQSRLIMNSAGEVESIGPISCDGGSYVVVEGTRIFTSSGFVASEDYYGKHLAGLRPGQTVTVTAVPTGSQGGVLTLDCVQCAIRVGG